MLREHGKAGRPARVLDARWATALLVMFVVLRRLAGYVAQMAKDSGQLPLHLVPVAELLAILAGDGTVLAVLILLFSGDLTRRTPSSAAWAFGSTTGIIVGMASGVLVAAGAVILEAAHGARVEIILHPAISNLFGLSGLCKLTSVLILAPAAEELLFRGVIHGGYRKSFGAYGAGALTTLIFCVLHVPRVVSYPAALLGIAGLAVTALWSRLRFAAIGPAVAVHFAYNAAMIFVRH